MLARLLFAACFTVVCSPAYADDTEAEVAKAITVLNDAFKDGNPDKIKALFTEDHVAVTSWGGAQTREQSLKTLPDLKIKEYAAGKLKIVVLGPDAALVTYSLGMKGTFKGKELPATSYASAVWVRKGGKWLESHYQETPIEK